MGNSEKEGFILVLMHSWIQRGDTKGIRLASAFSMVFVISNEY